MRRSWLDGSDMLRFWIRLHLLERVLLSGKDTVYVYSTVIDISFSQCIPVARYSMTFYYFPRFYD